MGNSSAKLQKKPIPSAMTLGKNPVSSSYSGYVSTVYRPPKPQQRQLAWSKERQEFTYFVTIVMDAVEPSVGLAGTLRKAVEQRIVTVALYTWKQDRQLNLTLLYSTKFQTLHPMAPYKPEAHYKAETHELAARVQQGFRKSVHRESNGQRYIIQSLENREWVKAIEGFKPKGQDRAETAALAVWLQVEIEALISVLLHNWELTLSALEEVVSMESAYVTFRREEPKDEKKTENRIYVLLAGDHNYWDDIATKGELIPMQGDEQSREARLLAFKEMRFKL